jgi:hypothetical protein
VGRGEKALETEQTAKKEKTALTDDPGHTRRFDRRPMIRPVEQ